jgi:hypothetical protein
MREYDSTPPALPHASVRPRRQGAGELLIGPRNAGIRADQHRKLRIGGDATYPLRAGGNELRNLTVGGGVEKKAQTILHDIVERDAGIARELLSTLDYRRLRSAG